MLDYDEYLYSLGLAPGTVRMYTAMLAKAEDWAAETGVDLRAPKASDLAELRSRFVESSATLRQVRCALQHYWDMHGVPNPPVKALRVPPKPRPHWRGLSRHDAVRLAQTAFGWHPQGTVVLIALYMGLRRSEIASMRWDRFDENLTEYRVLGKGLVQRVVPVHPTLARILRPAKGGYVWLFPGERRLHVAPATVWQWVREVGDEAGVQVHTHQLRHTSISAVVEATRQIEVGQTFAGHASIETTRIYTNVTAEQVREAVLALDWLPHGGLSGVVDA